MKVYLLISITPWNKSGFKKGTTQLFLSVSSTIIFLLIIHATNIMIVATVVHYCYCDCELLFW